MCQSQKEIFDYWFEAKEFSAPLLVQVKMSERNVDKVIASMLDSQILDHPPRALDGPTTNEEKKYLKLGIVWEL